MDSTPDLHLAERALLEHARRQRTSVTAGSLIACFAAGSADVLMNVAVPHGPEPEDWRPSVEALVALRGERGAVPRLEFMAELHQGLDVALAQQGFLRTSADPVMVLRLNGAEPPADAGPAAPEKAPPATDYRRLDGHDGGLLRAFVESQAEAFGMPPATGYAFLERLERTLTNGAAIGAALLRGGAPVAGAVLQLGSGPRPWGELAGVFTSPAWRRRGLAQEACRRLLADAHQAGVAAAWLSAAESAIDLYCRLGFRHRGTQHNYRYAPFSPGG